MKRNHPDNGREVLMKEDVILVTRTDMQGKIIFTNEAFVEISGYSEAELIGANHSIVRHPDMPQEAFADLWATVKVGKPWRGLVKNRTKQGDFYWVDANVSPVTENRQVVGYLSARYAPSREQIQAAESLYEKVRQKTKKIRHKHWFAKFNPIKNLTIKYKISLLVVLLLLPTIMLSTLFVSEKNVNIDFAAQELKGLEYVTPLKHLLTGIVEHRTLLDSNLQTSAYRDANAPTLQQSNNAVNETIKIIDAIDLRYGQLFNSSERWQKIKQEWLQLVTQVAPASVEVNLDQHNRVIEQISELLVYVSDKSNLTLDPEADTYYLMMLVSVRLPELTDYIYDFRNVSIYSAAKGGELVEKTKIQLAIYNQRLMNRYKKIEHDLSAVYEANPELKETLSVKEKAFSKDFLALLEQIQRDVYTPKTLNTSLAPQIASSGTLSINSINALYDLSNSVLKTRLEGRIAGLEQSKLLQLGSVFLVLVLVIVIAILIVRYFTSAFTQITQTFSKIGEGNFRNTIDLDGQDELGDLQRNMQVMQINLNVNLSETRDQARKAIRAQRALDNVSSCVMVANSNLEIIYLNKTIKNLFENAETDIRQELPEFQADKLLGANIDIFHKKPEHQRALLNKLQGSHISLITIANRHFSVNVNPVLDIDGQRIGTVAEWLDRTHEVRIEQEIEAMVDSVKSGELTNRLDLDDKQGFFLKLCQGINAFSDVIENVFTDINQTMEAMADGDLTHRINSDYQGVYLKSKNDINATIDKLSDVFGQVIESASFINNSSQEIASGNNNLSQRAEQQASSLEETAASMEQLTSTVRNNAQNAQQANLVANNARELAENGGSVVNAAVSAMQEINESSNRIADIIGVIDEIAFQTNLLALNASVEAARAGEQGRGFSVVATEVRNLAQRSATAAKESKELIQNSVERVRSGTEFVYETGKALSEIVTAVKKVGDIVAEIAAASVQQSAGIGQVNQAVSQLDEITQQNAALAEQASAASVSMSDLSTTMVDLLAFFTIDSNASLVAPKAVVNDDLFQRAQALTQTPISSPRHVSINSTDDEWQDF